MTYEKIAKHQVFVTEKGQALKESNFYFNRSTLRNKRLMQLNNLIMESLLELNAQTMSEAFAGESMGQEAKTAPELRGMEPQDVQITSSVQSVCLLLNDALEIELRRIHNEKEVLIDKRCIDLIKVTAQYTEIYTSLSSNLR